jgi:iron(III) transport system permease protein
LILVAAIASTVALADDRSGGLLVNTLTLAAATLSIAVPAGGFLGIVLARTNVWGGRFAAALLGGLLLVPLYLQAAAWQAGFGVEGWQSTLQTGGLRVPWLDGWRGAIWVHGCAGIPWVALFTGVAARSIPRTLEESALLDLSLARVFARVTLRWVLPALVLGALWVAIATMSEMSVTDLFAVRTYTEELYIELNAGSWNAIMGVGLADEGPVPALPGIVVMTMVAVAGLILVRGVMAAMPTPSSSPPLVFSLGRWRLSLTLITWLFVSAVVLLPLGSLIYKAGAFVTQTELGFERGWSAWKTVAMTISSPRDHAAEFRWSLLMASCTACVTLLVAVPLAYATRTNRFARLATLVLAVGGLAVPGPLLSLGLISVFNDPAWPWLNYFYDRTITVAVLAQATRAFPLAFFLAWCGLRTIPRSHLEAAQLDGAGPLKRIWLAVRQRPATVAVAAVAAFVISLGELAATILVVPPGIAPLSVRIFGLLHYNVEDQVAAISLMLVLLHSAATLVVLAAGRRVFRIA